MVVKGSIARLQESETTAQTAFESSQRKNSEEI